MSKSSLIRIPHEFSWHSGEMFEGFLRKNYAVAVAHRGAQKTRTTARRMVQAAVEFKFRDGRFYYIAPTLKQAKRTVWSILKEYTEKIPGATPHETDHTITFLHNGAQIILVGATDPDSLRGAYYDGVVFDEYGDQPPNIYEEIVRPRLVRMQGGKEIYHGWVIFIGTPKGINQFYDILLQAMRDTENWYVGIFPVSYTKYISDKELEQIRASMSHEKYMQEFECSFIAINDGTLIGMDVIQAAIDRKYSRDDYATSPIILGVDTAHYGGDKTVCYVRQGFNTLDIRKATFTDSFAVAQMVLESARDWNVDATFVDATGNKGPIDVLRQMNFRFTPVNFSQKPRNPQFYGNIRAEMYDALKSWLMEGGSIPNDPELMVDLAIQKFIFRETDGRMILQPKKDMERSPNVSDALALTFALPVFKHNEAEKLSTAYNPYAALEV